LQASLEGAPLILLCSFVETFDSRPTNDAYIAGKAWVVSQKTALEKFFPHISEPLQKVVSVFSQPILALAQAAAANHEKL
jgi:hypothetical protein